ncbi:MAG TPA: hypothetical protein VF003_17020, partial [Pseudonocardiaceae bacterium]
EDHAVRSMALPKSLHSLARHRCDQLEILIQVQHDQLSLLRHRLCAAIERADDGVIGGADDVGMKKPRRRGADGAGVVMVTP